MTISKQLKTVLAFLILLAPVFAVESDDSSSDTKPFVFTTTYASSYVFRGEKIGDTAVEPELDYTKGNLDLGIWQNIPVPERMAGQSDLETDFYGSYGFNVKDVVIAPGFYYYYYPKAPLNDGNFRSSFEPNVSLEYSYKDLTVTPIVSYDVVLKGFTGQVTLGYTVKTLVELDFAIIGGEYYLNNSVKDDSVKNYGDYWSAGVTIPYTVNGFTKLNFGWAYNNGDSYDKSNGVTEINDLKTSKGVVTVGLVISF